MSFIETNALRMVYGNYEVLKGFDLSAGRHQGVGLIGAFGSGTSTLLRGINAMEMIDRAQIVIDGHVVSGRRVDQGCQRPRHRRVPQGAAIGQDHFGH